MKHTLNQLLAAVLALCLMIPMIVYAEDEEGEFSLSDLGGVTEEIMLDDDLWGEDEEEATPQPGDWENDFVIGDGLAAIEENLDALVNDGTLDPGELNINPNLPDHIINILLIGVDMHENDINAKGNLLHNDTNIILSINTQEGTVKLTSIARDLYVNLPGYSSMQRINLAYALGTRDLGENGGPLLTMRTVNTLFDLNITQYVIINFYGLASIIEHIGGIDVDMVKGEANAINQYLKKNGSRMTYDTKGNANREPLEVRKELSSEEKYTLHLDGIQALMYARLRTGMKNNTGDLARTARQRHLLELLLKKVLNNVTVDSLTDLITYSYPYAKTNISAGTMLQLAVGVLQGDIITRAKNGEEIIENHRVPLDKGYSYKDVDGASVITLNDRQMNNCVESIHYFIYDAYYPSN